MNNHPASQDISDFVAGASGVAVAEHVNACPACRAEAAQMAGSLALFRDAVRQWSLEAEGVRPPWMPQPMTPKPVTRRRFTLPQVGWATAALGICVAAVLTLPLDRHRNPTPATAATVAISDAELLVRVDRQLSQAVPTSFEPIALKNNEDTQ
jgi:predicted anti-sigma-YlaC factor YlaD